MNHYGLAIAALVGASVAAGCAITTGDGERLRPGQTAFADYVESVFRLQNEAATDLAFELDSAEFESPRYERIEAAETALLDACDGLNAIASARQRGEERRSIGSLRAARKAPECERAARAAIGLLAETG